MRDIQLDEIEPVLTDKNGLVVTETMIDIVKESIKDKLKDVGIKPSTLSKMIGLTMEAVEDSPVKGPEQKEFAIKIITTIVEELPENNPEKTFLVDSITSGSIDGTIELVVAASKNELTINHVVEVSKACLPTLLDYISTRCGSRRKK
tara:strand:+ start:761 stop:1204 length:444 start_codon:yes stop_codon:yes gene_type:complete